MTMCAAKNTVLAAHIVQIHPVRLRKRKGSMEFSEVKNKLQDPDTALGIAERMSAVTQIISSLEFLASKEDQRVGGLSDWTIVRGNFEPVFPRFVEFLDRIGEERTESIVHSVRVAAGLSLFLPGKIRRHRVMANAFLAASALVLHPKHFYGSDGSDQLAFLVQSTSAVSRIGDSRRRKETGLQFLAAQSGLAYLTSGAVKLVSRTWRSGEALPAILRTRTYGDRELFFFLRKHPRLSRAAAHGVLAAETAFPLVFVLPLRPALMGVAGMGVFHLLNARYMGLARFVWAFIATYPAIIYVVLSRNRPGVT